MLFSFSRSRAPGRRAAAEARTEVRASLGSAACLTRSRTQANLSRVRILSFSVFLLLEFYSRLWLVSSIIDHRSLLNSCFQDSFDVTLVCADVHFGFVELTVIVQDPGYQRNPASMPPHTSHYPLSRDMPPVILPLISMFHSDPYACSSR